MRDNNSLQNTATLFRGGAIVTLECFGRLITAEVSRELMKAGLAGGG